jgi:hypothetical protein
MKELFIITCYQFEITDVLIKLLGRENCRLVVDSRPDDFELFRQYYADIILVAGRFGYYTVDEAKGRLDMMLRLSEYLEFHPDYDWIHVISQNDLPTAAFYYRDQILEKGKEYMQLHRTGWLSNYMTISVDMVHKLASTYHKDLDLMFSRFYDDFYNKVNAAPSEYLWAGYAKNVINRVDDDLRLEVYHEPILDIDSRKLGHFTKSSSPFTLDDTPETRHVLSDAGWWLFARKFDYKSPIYNWAYSQALNKYQ